MLDQPCKPFYSEEGGGVRDGNGNSGNVASSPTVALSFMGKLRSKTPLKITFLFQMLRLGQLRTVRYFLPLHPLPLPPPLPTQATHVTFAPKSTLPNPNQPSTSIFATVKLDLINAHIVPKCSSPIPILSNIYDAPTKGPASHAPTALIIGKAQISL